MSLILISFNLQINIITADSSRNQVSYRGSPLPICQSPICTNPLHYQRQMQPTCNYNQSHQQNCYSSQQVVQQPLRIIRIPFLHLTANVRIHVQLSLRRSIARHLIMGLKWQADQWQAQLWVKSCHRVLIIPRLMWAINHWHPLQLALWHHNTHHKICPRIPLNSPEIVLRVTHMLTIPVTVARIKWTRIAMAPVAKSVVIILIRPAHNPITLYRCG